MRLCLEDIILSADGWKYCITNKNLNLYQKPFPRTHNFDSPQTEDLTILNSSVTIAGWLQIKKILLPTFQSIQRNNSTFAILLSYQEMDEMIDDSVSCIKTTASSCIIGERLVVSLF